MIEWDRIATQTGYAKPPTPGLSGFERGRSYFQPGVERGPATMLTCPLLQKGACSVYEIRPLICRLFGLTKRMQCPHGCQPSRWLSDEECATLLIQAERIARAGGERTD